MDSHCGLSRELGGIFPSGLVSRYQLCHYKMRKAAVVFAVR